MSGDNKEPNAILNALSNTIAAIRADDDMLELAKAHEGLHPKALSLIHI